MRYKMLMKQTVFNTIHRLFRVSLSSASALIIAVALIGPAPAIANKTPLGIQNLEVCMNFSCRRKDVVSLSEEDWDSVANWLLQPVEDAAAERENIKRAIGWMEVVVGRYTPTNLDVGGDLQNGRVSFPGQLDCIDESLNTTTYMKLFERNGLLKYHTVVERAYRRSIFDQHWAGQIETLDGGERWVVDSWFQDNGYLPYLQETSAWEEIPFFTSYLDTSQKNPEEQKVSFLKRLFKKPASAE